MVRQRRRQGPVKRAPRKMKLTRTNVDLHWPDVWAPTLVDSELRRYMLRYPSINFDTADFPVYVHEPSAAMREVGCTTCVGRHNPQSTHCSANSTGLDILSLADGLRVFDIATLQPLPGVYVLSDTVMQGQKGTARLQLHH